MGERRSLATHLLRGLIGIGGLALAVSLWSAHLALSLVAFAVALLALRGCPLCWTLGLLQIIVARLRGTTAPAACSDGRCSLGSGSKRGGA